MEIPKVLQPKSAASNRIGLARKLAVSALCALVLSSSSALSAQAQRRFGLIRVLGVCRQSKAAATASIVTEDRRVKVLLRSADPLAYAGFEIVGINGLDVEDLKLILMTVEPEKPEGVLLLRVGTRSGYSQFFTLGADSNPDLPNIPYQGPSDDNEEVIVVDQKYLLQAKSKLKTTDRLDHLSFLYSSSAKGQTQSIKIQQFNVNDQFKVPILSEIGDCAVLFGGAPRPQRTGF